MAFSGNSHHSIIRSSQYDQPQSLQVKHDQKYNNPLINSAVGSNEIDDEALARQEQERLQFESFMDVDDVPLAAAGLDPNRFEVIDADTAYALQLQQEEYSRKSIVPSRRPYVPYKQESNNRTSSTIFDNSNDQPILTDAELAAHLQAEENQKRSQYRSRPQLSLQQRPPRQPINRTFNFDEPEIIPMPLFARPTPHDPSSNGNNNRATNELQNPFRFMASRGRSFLGGGRRPAGARRARNLQNMNEDFGPEHYETLLGLDDSDEKKKLTKQQINTLPTEKFHRSAQKNDVENQCSICMDQFEQDQTLRRLPCLHLYHQNCIDRWLQTNNLCPVCRLPPI